MAQENVEVVRRLTDIMRDLASERIADFWDPDGDYYPVRKFPESRPCHGPDEIQSFMAEYVRAEGRESGAALEGDLYQCFWLRHGRLSRQEDHVTNEGALRALGLGEDSDGALEAAGLSG